MLVAVVEVGGRGGSDDWQWIGDNSDCGGIIYVGQGNPAFDRPGGKGGDVQIFFKEQDRVLSYAQLEIYGGNAGDGGVSMGDDPRFVGNGGNGGAVSFDANDDDVVISDRFLLESGKNGGSSDTGQGGLGGVGGSVRFRARSFIVAEGGKVKLEITRHLSLGQAFNPSVSFRVDITDVRRGDLDVLLLGTNAHGDNDDYGVMFGTVLIGYGHEMKIRGNGAYSISGFIFGEKTGSDSSVLASERSSVGEPIFTPAVLNSEMQVDLKGKHLTFYLPESLANGSVLLENKGAAIMVDDAVIDLKLSGEDLRALQAGDKIYLVHGSVKGEINNKDELVSFGAKEWHFHIETEDEGLAAQLEGDGAGMIDPAKSEAYFYSNAASLQALLYGADQVSGIEDYIVPDSVRKLDGHWEELLFLQGSGYTYQSLSQNILVNRAFHAMAGYGLRYRHPRGQFLGVGFVEGQDGSYDVYPNQVHAMGDVNYKGVGFYGKQLWFNGWFLNGAARAGRIGRDFDSRSMIAGRYDWVNSTYYGLQIGGGRIIPLAPHNLLILDGQWLATYMAAFSTKSQAGEALTFDAAQSQRAQLEARYEYRWDREAKFYVATSLEKEFAGTVSGVFEQEMQEAIDNYGTSLALELGSKFTAPKFMPGWSARAALRGVLGSRHGTAAKLGIGYRW